MRLSRGLTRLRIGDVVMQKSLKHRIMMMNGVYSSLTFGFILVILGCIPAWAAPTVTGVAGTVANGQSITITGSSFGATGPTVLLFDDFEGGTNGNQLSTNLAPLGTWDSITSAGNISYSNANKVSGNLAARFNCYNYPPNQNPVIQAKSPSVFDSFYVSFWAMLPSGNTFPGDGYGGSNWKVVWVCKDDACNDADVCIMGQSWTWWHWFGNDCPLPSNHAGGGNFMYSDGTDITFSSGLWYRFSWWQKGRTDNTGATYMILTNAVKGTWTANSLTNLQTLNSGDSGKRQYFFVNGYVRDTPNSYPTFDDVYIATGEYAQARVEIGNASTYANCTSLTMCTTPLGTSGWSNTSISCVVRQGGLSNGSAWVYVTDANGNVNSTGYPITIGGKSGNSRPIPPADVKMY